MFPYFLMVFLWFSHRIDRRTYFFRRLTANPAYYDQQAALLETPDFEKQKERPWTWMTAKIKRIDGWSTSLQFAACLLWGVFCWTPSSYHYHTSWFCRFDPNYIFVCKPCASISQYIGRLSMVVMLQEAGSTDLLALNPSYQRIPWNIWNPLLFRDHLFMKNEKSV